MIDTMIPSDPPDIMNPEIKPKHSPSPSFSEVKSTDFIETHLDDAESLNTSENLKDEYSGIRPLTLSYNPHSFTNSARDRDRDRDRKRMSMNFSALPVVASSSPPRRPSKSHFSHVSPLKGGVLQTINSNTIGNAGDVFNRTNRSYSASSGASATSNVMERTHNVNASSCSSTSSIDEYLSQLACRERRVVEIKDEIQRLQQELRSAESDLLFFRRHVPTTLAPAKPSRIPLSPSRQSIERNSVEFESRSDRNVSQDSSRLVSNQYGNLNRSSLDARNSDEFDSRRSIIPPSDDVFNMGKRVVGELGHQFWGLFEDLKNVTIGEEARDPLQQKSAIERPLEPMPPVNESPTKKKQYPVASLSIPSNYISNPTPRSSMETSSSSTNTSAYHQRTNSYYIV